MKNITVVHDGACFRSADAELEVIQGNHGRINQMAVCEISSCQANVVVHNPPRSSPSLLLGQCEVGRVGTAVEAEGHCH